VKVTVLHWAARKDAPLPYLLAGDLNPLLKEMGF